MASPAQSRAYALIAFKSVNDEARVLTGMATTPAPDRHGDIVEPLGLTFDNPAPLLLHHDATQPVGTVKFSRPTKDGLPFEAHIPEIVEPGPLRDRVQEAWLSAKAGLLRGVSVRLMAKPDDVELMKGGGLRWLKAKVLELSLVTIPANAEASVASIKTLDVATRAALGLPDDSSVHLPGASGSTRVVKATPSGRAMKKSYAEQIKDFEATRAAKVGEMDALLEKHADAGTTFDAAEKEQHQTLTEEVKAIDEHLVILRAAEERNKQVAKPVAGANSDEGTRSRGGHVITVKEQQLPPGIAFTRMVICKAVAAASRGVINPLDVAKERYPSHPGIQEALKTAVPAANTLAGDYSPLATVVQYTGDFVEFLRNMTILGKFGTNGVPALRAVPFNINIKAQTGGGTGYWVGQGKAKPLTAQQFDDLQIPFTKVAAISVATQESLRFSTPSLEQLIRNDLAAAIAERMDIDFIDPDKAAVANVSPASVTNGVTAIESSGSDLDGVTADIKAIFTPFMDAKIPLSSGVWIMNSTTALALSLMRTALGDFAFPNITMQGGTFQGLPVIVSDYVGVSGSPTSHIVVLVNASDIYLADDGQVTVNASTEASLLMDDNPTGMDSTTPNDAQLVSMFQTNSVALLAERYVNWKKRRAEAVAYLDGVAWGSA